MLKKQQGCDECKDCWQFSKVAKPKPICSSDDRQAVLYRCSACSSYWEESQRFAYVLSDEELEQYYALCLKKYYGEPK